MNCFYRKLLACQPHLRQTVEGIYRFRQDAGSIITCSFGSVPNTPSPRSPSSNSGTVIWPDPFLSKTPKTSARDIPSLSAFKITFFSKSCRRQYSKKKIVIGISRGVRIDGRKGVNYQAAWTTPESEPGGVNYQRLFNFPFIHISEGAALGSYSTILRLRRPGYFWRG